VSSQFVKPRFVVSEPTSGLAPGWMIWMIIDTKSPNRGKVVEIARRWAEAEGRASRLNATFK
jgi:hypothetical protein